MNASAAIAQHTLLSCALILGIGTLAAFVAQKIRVPDVAIFLIVGIALGPHALGLVNIPATSALNEIIVLFGASYILFDGGAALRLSVLKQVWITIAVIATLGVVITAGITGLAAHWLLGLPLATALLLGTAVASTDPATLIPIFRVIRIRNRVAQTLMSESAFNDAVGAILTFTLLSVAEGTGPPAPLHLLFALLGQFVIGIGAG